MEAEKTQDPRTEETRRNLIEVGIRLFGQKGYDAVSTRTITSEAQANLSAITYHFGGKEPFYQACLHAILDKVAAEHNPLVDVVDPMIARAGSDRLVLSEAIAQICWHMTGGILLDRRFDHERAFLIREHAVPSPFYGEFVQSVPHLMLDLSERLVSAATSAAPGSQETKVRGFVFFGQLMALMIGREVLRLRLAIEDYTPAIRDMIWRQASLSMTASIDLPAPDFDHFTPLASRHMTQGPDHE